VEIPATDDQETLIVPQIRKVIELLGPGIDQMEVTATPTRGEWQGLRRVPGDKAATWTQEEQYAELETDTLDGPVILYLHGGAYILCSINSHRPLTSHLAEKSHARLLAVEYRLAPQNPFPCALVDALCAYRYLIDPPPGALHKPIHPSKIVVAGDSAGVCPGLAMYDLSVGWLGLCPDDRPRAFRADVPIARGNHRRVPLVGPDSLVPVCKAGHGT
jgi:alpha/beta hydrolase fold